MYTAGGRVIHADLLADGSAWRSGEGDEGLLWAGGPWSMESMEPLFVISLLIEGLSA